VDAVGAGVGNGDKVLFACKTAFVAAVQAVFVARRVWGSIGKV
jgi:hypothetical protein